MILTITRILIVLSLVASAFSANAALPLSGGWNGSGSEEELRRLRLDRDRLVREESNISRDLQRLQRDLQGAQRNEDVARRELTNLDRQLNQAQRQAINLRQQVSRLEQDIIRERQRKEQDIRSNETLVAQLRLAIDQAERRVASLQAELSDLSRQRNPARLKEIENQNAADRAELAKQQKYLESVQNRIKELENCRTNECLAVRLAMQKEEKRVSALIVSLNEAIAVRNREARELQRIEAQVAKKDQEVKAASADVRSKQNDMRQAESRLNEARNRQIPQERELPQKQAELRRADAEVNRIESRKNQVEQDHRRYEAELRRVSADVSREERRLREVQADLNRVERRIAELERNQNKERVVIVGRDISGLLEQDLINSRVSLVEEASLETDSNARFEVANSVNSILYIMADTLSQGLSVAASDLVSRVIDQGGLVMIVGNPAKLGLDPASQLAQVLNVEARFATTASRISGRASLNGLEIQVRANAIELVAGSSWSSTPEKVLVNERSETIGVSIKRGNGRAMVLGLDNQNLELGVLGQVEEILCQNIRHSSEYSVRRICH